MKNKPKILFIIAARGGSKGVAKKNLQKIAGLSLLGYKALSAQSCKSCNRILLTTDDPEIINEGKSLGLEIPFTRPENLANDTATSDSVVSHVINWVETYEKISYDAIMLLEPSSPFSTSQHYEEAIEMYRNLSADLVVGVREVDTPSIFIAPKDKDRSIKKIVERLKEIESVRRQEQNTEITPNGTFYLIDWKSFKSNGKIYGNPEASYGLLMDHFHSIEIETPKDLAYAKFVVSNGYLDMGPWSDKLSRDIKN